MRMVFDSDVEDCDFMEILLNRKDAERLLVEGIIMEFESGVHPERPLNVCLSVEEE